MRVITVVGTATALFALGIFAWRYPNLVLGMILLPGIVLVHLGSLVFPFDIKWENGVSMPFFEVVGLSGIGQVPLTAAVFWLFMALTVWWWRRRVGERHR